MAKRFKKFEIVKVVKNEYRLFKVTPHQSVLNSTNRKLLATLHDVMSMYEGAMSRTSREGRQFFYRLKDDFWWIMTIEGQREKETDQEEAGSAEEKEVRRQVSFYLCITETFASVFLTKFKNHDQWKRCTVQEVPMDTIQLPGAESGNMDFYKLKYQRHNMFSLSYDYARQTVPVRELVSVSQEVGAGEFAGLFVRGEVVGRKKWKGLGDYVWGAWDEGKVPQRNNIDPARLMRQLWGVFEAAFRGLKGIIDDVMLGMERTFFATADQEAHTTRNLSLENPERKELLVNGELSQYTRRKRNLPVFRADMFVAVGSESQERRGMLARSVGSAFNELKGDNQLIPVKVSITFKGEDGWQGMAKRHDMDPNMMSTEELGKVMQLPTRDVQEEFREELVANRKIEIDVPRAFRDESGIFMGTATNRDEKYSIHIPTKDPDMLMTARAFIGSPRMGKDQACINLIVEAQRKHGIGAVIPDVVDERGNRGMADAIRDHLPPESVIDLNLGDYDWPVRIGLESAVAGIKNERIATNRIAQELTSFLMGDDVSNHQTREYLREAAKLAGGDLEGIKRVLMDEGYRKEKVRVLQEQGRDVSFWEHYGTLTESRQSQIISPILMRLGELMGDDMLRPIFAQKPNPEMDLRKWIHEGKVVIYRIPSRDIGEMNVKVLVHWIVMVTFLTKLSMGREGASTFLVLNEPHQFLSPGLIHFCQRLLVEGPKVRLSPVFLAHNFKQLPGDFVEILISSSLNWHIFKNTNDHVYQRLANYLYPTFTPEMAMAATKRFQYIASWLDHEGEYQPPFMMSAPPMVDDRYPGQDNSWLTKKHSRLYGRNIREIEKDFRRTG